MDLNLLRSEWTFLTGAIVTIFFIVDPFAVVPVYLTLTERFSPQDARVTRVKATFVATGILIIFAVTGMGFFNLFGITLPAFQIAGGILLLLLGFEQLNAKRSHVDAEEEIEGLDRNDISVFPLAMPMLAGPAAISSVILYSTEAQSYLRVISLVLAVLVAMIASFVILGSSRMLLRVFGKTGLNLLSRIMGLVLTAIAVQFVINGAIGVWERMKA